MMMKEAFTFFSWGSFNTVARRCFPSMMKYSETDQWDEIYQKVCDKGPYKPGNGQDFTFTDYIADKYPDLVMASGNCGYADIQQQSTDRQMHFTHSRLTG